MWASFWISCQNYNIRGKKYCPDIARALPGLKPCGIDAYVQHVSPDFTRIRVFEKILRIRRDTSILVHVDAKILPTYGYCNIIVCKARRFPVLQTEFPIALLGSSVHRSNFSPTCTKIDVSRRILNIFSKIRILVKAGETC